MPIALFENPTNIHLSTEDVKPLGSRDDVLNMDIAVYVVYVLQ